MIMTNNEQVASGMWQFFCVLLLLFSHGLIMAENSLFQIDVPVRHRAEGSPRAEVVTGLEQILLRLTSEPEVLEQAVVKESLLSKADNFLVQYRYQQDDKQSLFVRLTFDGEQLIQQLENLQIKQWPGKRPPQVLVWLLADDTLDPNAMDVMQEKFEQSAKRLGLRLVFPLFDVTEQSLGGRHLVKEELSQQLLQQYHCDFLLVGDVSLDPIEELWSARWELLGSIQWSLAKNKWHHSQFNLSPLVQNTLFGVRDFLWQQAALQNVQPMQILLSVQNIKAHADYQRVLNYLRHLPMVKSVHLQSLKSDEAVYQVRLNEHLNLLTHALAKSDLLLPKKVESQDTSTLKYQLIL